MSIQDLTYTNDVCRLVLSKPLSAATTGFSRISGTPTTLTESSLPSPAYWVDFAGDRALPSDYINTRSTVGTYYDADGYVKLAQANIPRFHYDPETKECRGLLIERATTNTITDNRMTSTAADPFAVGTGGLTKNYITGITIPSGVSDTTNFYARYSPSDLTNQIKYALRSETWSGANSVFSAFFKLTNPANPVYPILIMDDAVNGGCFARFDLVNGTVSQAQASGSGTYYNSGVEKLPNGWARCWVSGNGASGSNGRAAISIRNNSNTTNGYDPAWTATSTIDGVYVLWPQIEKSCTIPRPTSVILTNGVFTSRAADLVELPNPKWLDTTKGTFVIDFHKTFTGSWRGNNSMFTAYSSVFDYMPFFSLGASIVNYSVYVNLQPQTDLVGASNHQYGRNRIVQSYRRDEVIFSVNGTTFGYDTTAEIPLINAIRLGADVNATGQLNDCVSRLIYYAQPISQDMANTLSNPNEF